MTKKNIALVVLMIIAACAALVYGLSFIPKRGDPGVPESKKSVVSMGPITVVKWDHRFEGEYVTRTYDEQTHMVCYERNAAPLGCATLDLGILPEAMKTGIDLPEDEAIVESHGSWREGEPDEPETVHGR